MIGKVIGSLRYAARGFPSDHPACGSGDLVLKYQEIGRFKAQLS